MLEVLHDAVAKVHAAMDELIGHVSAHKDEMAKVVASVQASVQDIGKKVAALQEDAAQVKQNEADHSADDLNAAEVGKNDAAAV